MTDDQLLLIVLMLEEILCHGGARNNQLCLDQQYRAMSLCLSDLLWVRNLLSELNLFTGTMRIWCDNKSVINIANNLVQHERTKHVEIDRFFIKERLDDGTLKLRYVTSRDQVAGCLTKGL
jgi:hypothetical protein